MLAYACLLCDRTYARRRKTTGRRRSLATRNVRFGASEIGTPETDRPRSDRPRQCGEPRAGAGSFATSRLGVLWDGRRRRESMASCRGRCQPRSPDGRLPTRDGRAGRSRSRVRSGSDCPRARRRRSGSSASASKAVNARRARSKGPPRQGREASGVQRVDDRVQRRARAHRLRGLHRIRLIVAAEVDGLALGGDELRVDLRRVLPELFCHFDEA